ncbi:MAG: AAA family ATPase [Lachnospiraceae bacterium]|nr:AAA family ATPase [Lachnospiraceae bacterium]
MNYLKRQDALTNAINEKFKGKSDEKRHAEIDKLYDLFKEMANIYTGVIEGKVDDLIKKTKGVKTKSEDPIGQICAIMVKVNQMCLKYGVKPMFPEAGSDAEPDEIKDACNTYFKQGSVCGRLSRDTLNEGVRTGDLKEFNELHDRLVNDIEEIIKKEDNEDGSDADPKDDTVDRLDDYVPEYMGFEENAEDYLINLNSGCRHNSAMFRDSVINQTLSCLIGRSKPNALLVGAAGVGKTVIVEDIAGRLERKDPRIPDQLKGFTIWEFPLSGIVSGSSLVGDLERKLKAVLDYASDPEKKVILFIDEVHMLISGMQSYDKIAQIMKPALARGDIKVIGATTLQEVQNFMNDPAFNRRFTRIIVDEISQEQTVELLKSEARKLMDHYNGIVTVDDELLSEVVSIADDYRTAGSHRPDNAITLLDRTMADTVVEQKGAKKGRRSSANKAIKLDGEKLRETAMRLMTGNNIRAVVDIDELKKSLSVIRGQDKALEYLIDTIRRDNLSTFPRKKPLTFLFAGSSGVGKTEVSKIIAETITGVKPIILNMTEFTSSADVNKITGTPIGYKGSDSKAELPFDILESNPYQIIVLDEFEKCDKAVQRLFMSAFDEGYFKTARGKTVDFSRSIIIATTNAGYSKEKKRIGFSFSDDDKDEKSVVELSEYYDVELLNRFTKILNFRPISEKCYKEIMKNTYAREVKRIKSSGGNKYDFLPNRLTEDVTECLTKESYNENFGARPVNRTIQKFIEDMILEKNQ